jgi:hypothetical protein
MKRKLATPSKFSKPLFRRRYDQRGMSLASVAALMVVAGFLAIAIAGFTRQQQRFRLRSQVDGNLQAGLDAGYDKALGVLNDNTPGNSNWANAGTIVGFASITAVPQADLPDLQYWVKIMPGVRADTTNAGSANDLSLTAWTNQGDLIFDRTIFVRARHNITGRETVAVATVHRNDVAPFNPLGGITSTNGVNTAGWGGKSYKSCTGLTNTAAVQTPGCNGTVAGNGVTAASMCLTPMVIPTTTAMPTVVIPAGTVPFPGNTAVTQDFSLSGNVTLGPGPIAYQCNNLSASGNRQLVINTNGTGPVRLYITGNISWSGTGDIKSPGLAPGGSPPEAIVYCNGTTVSLKGTGTYEILLIAPRAAVTINGGGNGSFSGAIIADSMNVTGGGNGTFYFDECLLQARRADNYERPPLITLSWRRVR